MNTHIETHTPKKKKKEEQEKENEAELANGLAVYLALAKINPSQNCFSHLSHGQKWSYLFTVLFGLARDPEWLRGNQ